MLIDNKYTFKDIVDIEKLRSMFESFSRATGFTTALLSCPEQELLIQTGWRDICTKFHHINPNSKNHCRFNNHTLTVKLNHLKKLNILPCESGLVDGATPITIKGIHVATLLTGQILFNEPDLDYFKKQGKSFGFNVDAYLKALQQVPVVSEAEFKTALTFMSKMAVLIAEQGLANLEALNKIDIIKTQRDLSQKLAEAKTLDDALTTCLDIAIRIAGADCGGIYLMDKISGRINLMRTKGLSDEFIESVKHHEADSDHVQIVNAGKPLYLSFEQLDIVIGPTQMTEGLRSLAILPVQSEGQSIASINIASHEFDEIPFEVRDILESTIFQIATVLAKTISYETIKVSENKFRAIFDQTFEFIGLLSTDGIVLEVNKTALDFAGIKESDVVGKPFWETQWWSHSKELQDQLFDAIKKAANGEFIRFEATHPGPDGMHLIDFSLKPVKDELNNIVFIIPEGRDITNRKNAEEALKTSENKFRSIIESSPMGIHMYELQDEDRLVFTGANPSADTILNVDNSIFIGKTIEEAFPPLIESEVPERYKEAAAKGAPWRTEQIIYDEGDIKGAFEVVAFQTTPGKMVALFKDITSQKQKEKEVQSLRNLLNNIINSMPSILVGIDTIGKVTQWNREAEKITGIRASEALGNNLEKVYPELAGEMEKVKLSIRNRQAIKETKVARSIDGEIRYENITVFPLIDNGIIGAVIRVDDVTDIVRIEEMMIQSEKMLSVGGLAAGMAHEINNPLAGMIQNADVLRNRLTSDITANTRAADESGTTMTAIRTYMNKRNIVPILEMIHTSGLRAAKIVQNMLSFARKSDSKNIPINLIELLDRTIELIENDYDLKKKYDFRKIEIIREYEKGIPDIPCEASKIQQVFLNIIKNGAEAMHNYFTSENRNDKPCLVLRILRYKEMVQVEIEDNGPGIDKETQKRIFEPFFTTKGVGVGMGLGLSVSYFIITENHDGNLNVESTPGNGTKFIIRLPLEDKNQ